MSDTIRNLWQRIERVLQQHAPETAATLALPATDGEVDALEAAIGQTLPNDFRASLKIHNGQDDPSRCHAFCGEGMLLTTAEIANRWKMATEMDDRERLFAAPDHGPWWKRTCIPFTDAEGDMLCIDMDPSMGNEAGEVVCFIHDGEIERGLGANYQAWLTALAEQLEAGHFRIDEYGYLWLDTEVLPN